MIHACWITDKGDLIECMDTWDHWNKAIEVFDDADDPEHAALKAGWFKISGYSGNHICIGQKMNYLQRRAFEEYFVEPADKYEREGMRHFNYEFVIKRNRKRGS